MQTNPQISDKEKGFDFSNTIKPEVIETPPNYDYGRNQEALDYERLRNKPTTTASSKTLAFAKTAGSGTGVINFTGFGFKPTSYYIMAYYTGGDVGGAVSQVYYLEDGTVRGYHLIEGNTQNITGTMIVIYTTSTVNTRATHSSFLSDGIALNFLNDTVGINFVITANK